jgi:hypothetical protein
MCHEASCEVRGLVSRAALNSLSLIEELFRVLPGLSVVLLQSLQEHYCRCVAKLRQLFAGLTGAQLFCRGRQFLLCLLQSGILQDESSKKSNNEQHKPKDEFTLH